MARQYHPETWRSYLPLHKVMKKHLSNKEESASALPPQVVNKTRPLAKDLTQSRSLLLTQSIVRSLFCMPLEQFTQRPFTLSRSGSGPFSRIAARHHGVSSADGRKNNVILGCRCIISTKTLRNEGFIPVLLDWIVRGLRLLGHGKNVLRRGECSRKYNDK